LVRDRGGVEFPRYAGLPILLNPLCGSQTAGNLLVVEDLKRGVNKDMKSKDIFEMASKET